MTLFFSQRFSKFDWLSGYIRQRFSNLYEGGQGDNDGAFEEHFFHNVQLKRDERMSSNMILAKANGMTYEELSRLSWYDHHILLEQTRANSRQKTTENDW